MPCRLIGIPAPQEVADRRRRKAKEKARRGGRTPSKEYLALLSWTILVTSVPASMLSIQQVALLYGIRWQVELVFKLWKSYCGLKRIAGLDSIFGFLSALSPNYLWLALLRGLTGFGVGGTLPVDYSIFAEYLPTRKRGRYLVYLESFWALGTIVAAGLAWLVVPRFGWRVLLAISALPGLIVYFIRRYVPESPRYLLVEGREAEARAVLRQVAAENGVEFPVERLRREERKRKVCSSGCPASSWSGDSPSCELTRTFS